MIGILLELVKKEADELKKYVTQEQLNKLDIETLDGGCVWNCIYGQLFGYSEGAETFTTKNKCTDLVLSLNGRIRPIEEYSSRKSTFYFTPIEHYVCARRKKVFISEDDWMLENGNDDDLMSREELRAGNEQLIKYLKGEVDTLCC
jgi:hypothetical protein